MKHKMLFLMSILSMLCLFNPVYAENDESNNVNIREWGFKMLTCKSDQDPNVVVSKYYRTKDRDDIAFCVEANKTFIPVNSVYTKKKNDNEKVYEIVKAYNQLEEKDDNYFIAAQLLIWEETSGISYTFEGEDYSEYKDFLLEIIYPKPILKSINISKPIESYVGEEVIINEDYSEYNADAEGIEIVENSSEGFIYKISEEEPLIKTINFTPKDSDDDHSFIYESETSQDIYHFEGDYNDLKPFSFNVKSLLKPTNISIYYSKKDEYGNNISGAEFTVYEIDPENSQEDLVFIKENEDLDLFEAILGDYSSLTNLSIEISERYQRYLDGYYINAREIGYFPYKIYENGDLLKQGTVYVTSDNSMSNGAYARNGVKRIFRGYSEDLDKNSIDNLENNKAYYLCESEPKKGYTYASEPCVIVETDSYTGEIYEFVNSSRTYTLKLMKLSPEEVLLDGAKFKITYFNDDNEKNVIFTTGYLNIDRKNDYKYLIFKHESDNIPYIREFDSDTFMEKVDKPGKYYYYMSDSNIVNDSLLNDEYINVLKGGFVIDNMPYSSSITVEELQAPKGFIITEPVYHITPDISYSEITFKNYRVNSFDIIPAKKFRIPKTCIDE